MAKHNKAGVTLLSSDNVILAVGHGSSISEALKAALNNLPPQYRD